MANLSQDDRTVITNHPLDDSLDHLRDSLGKIELSHGPSSTSNNGASDTRDQGLRRAVSRLLSTLQGHDVAFILRSKTGNVALGFELATVFIRVQNGNFTYQQYPAFGDSGTVPTVPLEPWYGTGPPRRWNETGPPCRWLELFHWNRGRRRGGGLV